MFMHHSHKVTKSPVKHSHLLRVFNESFSALLWDINWYSKMSEIKETPLNKEMHEKRNTQGCKKEFGD